MMTVVIPAYRPDRALVEVTEKLWDYGYRIVVVDDGSGKEYMPVFDCVRERCVILTHLANRGKGAAIKTALRYIRSVGWECDAVGVMDADGQHMAEDMRKLLLFAQEHKNTLVLGVRSVGRKMPFRSRLGNRITRTVFRLVSGTNVSDTQTGLRAFGPELIPELLKVEGDRYEYEMNVLMAFARTGIPLAEVPVSTVYRDQGNSTSHFRVFRDSVRIYRDILKFALSSLSSFVLDYMLFSILMFFLPHTAAAALLANVTARIISACYNYAMNCRFVFHTKKRIGTAAGYFALAAFILVMNSLILETFVQILHMSVYPAKLLTECLLFVLSFLIQNGMIFRNRCSSGRRSHLLV